MSQVAKQGRLAGSIDQTLHMNCPELEKSVVFQHQRGSKVPALLVGDRKTWVLAVGAVATDVAFARDQDELEAHVGSIGVVAIGEEVVGDCCGKAARLVAAVVVGAGAAVAAVVVTGGGS